jgi:hypothetical protein
VPQFPQNFFPTGFSDPQFEQRMVLSENRTDISCIAHHGEKTHSAGDRFSLTGNPPGRYFPRRFHRHLSLSSPFITELSGPPIPAGDGGSATLATWLPRGRLVR